MLKKSIPVLGLIFCLGILTLGCARGVEEVPATTTTTTTITTTTTSTTTTTTTTTTTPTTSTTTTTIHGISGTITNYGGSELQLTVMVWKDQLQGGPVANATATVSGTQAAYSLTVEAAGNYYVAATDFNLGLTPEAHDWIGAYNWGGTISIEAAGDQTTLMMALQQNAGSIEVSSIATADFTMHEIITPEGVMVTANITHPANAGQNRGVKGMLFKVSDIQSFSDFQVPANTYRSFYQGNVSPGTTVNIQFQGVANNSYYCLVPAQAGQNVAVNDYIGVYGWSGTVEVSLGDLMNTVWSNKSSFEVTGSDKNLGVITLHKII